LAHLLEKLTSSVPAVVWTFDDSYTTHQYDLAQEGNQAEAAPVVSTTRRINGNGKTRARAAL
jgi:hypothetical protein